MLSFATPLWLLALAVAIPLGAFLLVRAERRRRADLASFGDPAVLARSSALGQSMIHCDSSGWFSLSAMSSASTS